MAGGSPAIPSKPYGMNQTVINDLFPALLPKINAANQMYNDFDIMLDHFSETVRLYRATRVVSCALRGAHSCWVGG